MRRLLGPILAVLSIAALAGSGQAYETGLCYETIGCVQDRRINESDAAKLGCDQLWTVRNGIYAVRGYCFKTDRARRSSATTAATSMTNRKCRSTTTSAPTLS